MQTFYKITNNGNLQIICDTETQQELVELGDNIVQDCHMYDCFESIICNGLSWISPETIGALTDAPILSEGNLDDNGNYTNDLPVYWYPNYMVRSPLEDLRDYCQTIFVKGE